MNAGQVAKAIEQIVEGAGTKSYRARKLFELGCDRTDVVELLGMSYSQAHSIWKERLHGTGPLAGRQSASVPKVRNDNEGDAQPSKGSGDRPLPRQAKAGRRGPLRLSPTQTRFVTQDGHVIVRVDKQDGPHCKKCDRQLTFTLVYLGFVHTDSTNEPTNMEDRYD